MDFKNSYVTEEAFSVSVSTLPLRGAIFLESSCPLIEAIDLLQSKNLGSLPITDHMKLVGTFSEKDLIQKVLLNRSDYHHITLAEVMSANPPKLTKENTLKECIRTIVKKDFNHFPLVNERGEPEYVISTRDILKFLMDQFPELLNSVGTLLEWDNNTFFPEEDRPLARNKGKLISGIPFLYRLNLCNSQLAYNIGSKATITEAVMIMKKYNLETLLVCEFGKDILGILTVRDILQKVVNKVELEKTDLPVTQFMSKSPNFLLGKHLLAHAANNLIKTGDKHIILIDQDGYPFAVLVMLSIIRFLSHTLFTDE